MLTLNTSQKIKYGNLLIFTPIFTYALKNKDILHTSKNKLKKIQNF